jgi:hypothetical protein
LRGCINPPRHSAHYRQTSGTQVLGQARGGVVP